MTTDSNATRDEARGLARRWPWSLAPHEKSRLWTLALDHVGTRPNKARVVVDLGAWLGRSPTDAHIIAREAREAALP